MTELVYKHHAEQARQQQDRRADAQAAGSEKGPQQLNDDEQQPSFPTQLLNYTVWSLGS